MAEKEATIFVIDVSESMGKSHQSRNVSDLTWCLDYVWDKVGIKIMAARKSDYVGVIIVGSRGSDNMMQGDEAYAHISVILPLPQRDSAQFKNYTFSKSHLDVIRTEVRATSVTEGDRTSQIDFTNGSSLGNHCSNTHD